MSFSPPSNALQPRYARRPCVQQRRTHLLHFGALLAQLVEERGGAWSAKVSHRALLRLRQRLEVLGAGQALQLRRVSVLWQRGSASEVPLRLGKHCGGFAHNPRAYGPSQQALVVSSRKHSGSGRLHLAGGCWRRYRHFRDGHLR